MQKSFIVLYFCFHVTIILFHATIFLLYSVAASSTISVCPTEAYHFIGVNNMVIDHFIEANKMVSVLNGLISHLETIIDEIPGALLMALNIIPKRLTDLKIEYQKMIRKGYQIDYLNVEYNIEEIEKKIQDIMAKIRVLNLEDAVFDLKTMLEYTDSVFNDFEKEKIARKSFEESVNIFKSKAYKINDFMNKLSGRVKDAKYNYKLSETELVSLDSLNEDLLILEEDFTKLYDTTKTSSFPYTRLTKELEMLIIKLSEIEEKLDKYIESIGNMQEDEKRAREQLTDMTSLLESSKHKMREYKLPIIPNNYFIELKEANEAIREIVKELDKKPINIDVLNTRVDTARDLVFKIHNTSNELIKTAQLAETAIIYGNRYRTKKQYVDDGLNKAEIIQRVNDVIEMFSLGEIRNQAIDSLSEGQKQKVGLATVVAMQVKNIILDEPTANLDPESTEELAKILQRLKNENYCIMVVDHRLYYLKDYADKVYILEQGSVVEEGNFNVISNEVINSSFPHGNLKQN